MKCINIPQNPLESFKIFWYPLKSLQVFEIRLKSLEFLKNLWIYYNISWNSFKSSEFPWVFFNVSKSLEIPYKPEDPVLWPKVKKSSKADSLTCHLYVIFWFGQKCENLQLKLTKESGNKPDWNSLQLYELISLKPMFNLNLNS